MKAPQYWRSHPEWQKWLGRKGTVIASTLIRVAAPEMSELLPYSYVLVEFGDGKTSHKKELMGAGHEVFAVGDTVECVLRKVAVPRGHELIPYGVKVTKAQPKVAGS